ncbi:MAG TPA: hypothetical protein VEH06_04955 [Candidatus Bathyarchaeia archaeon]|nr:hypothetical protein [Candidatus Bathyarchaeia archaeon]
MIQKHIVISMIVPVTVAGILIMAILANQAYSSSGSLTSVKCKITKHGHTKCKTKTITPPQGASNTGATSAAGGTSQPSSSTGNGRNNILVPNTPTSSSQKSSNAGNGATSTATIQLKCTTGYIWYPKPWGGFRHCALGAMVNAPQGSSNTHPGLKTES